LVFKSVQVEETSLLSEDVGEKVVGTDFSFDNLRNKRKRFISVAGIPVVTPKIIEIFFYPGLQRFW
jgi:hypothetical protein